MGLTVMLRCGAGENVDHFFVEVPYWTLPIPRLLLFAGMAWWRSEDDDPDAYAVYDQVRDWQIVDREGQFHASSREELFLLFDVSYGKDQIVLRDGSPGPIERAWREVNRLDEST